MREVTPAALDGQRLDRIVAMITGRSRSDAAALIDAGAVAVAGRVATTRSMRVAEGDVVDIEVVDRPEEVDLVADPSVDVPLLYEDAHLLVVDKPAGLVVHPGAGQGSGTLVHGLLARFPEVRSVGQPDRPGIVHRLDKGTSGVLLVARTPEAYDALVALLATRRVDRRYRALVWGRLQAPSGLVDAPIGRSRRDRTRMSVTVSGKSARTRYELLRVYETPAVVSEIVCTLETGRTHQIRVHLASIGHPVVGDPRYGGDRRSLPCPRPWLHAERVALDHPVTGERLEVASPLPSDLERIRAVLS